MHIATVLVLVHRQVIKAAKISQTTYDLAMLMVHYDLFDVGISTFQERLD